MKKILLCLSMLITTWTWLGAEDSQYTTVNATKLKVFYNTYMNRKVIVENAFLSSEIRPAKILQQFFLLSVYDNNQNGIGNSWMDDNGLNIVVREDLASKWSDYCDANVPTNRIVKVRLVGSLSKMKDILEFSVLEINKILIITSGGEVAATLVENGKKE
jgi:hypothetical protein